MKPEGEVRHYETGLLPIEVDVFLNTFEGPGWIKRQLRGSRGWLQVAKATMSTPFGDWTATLVVAMTDYGELLDKFVAQSLLDMRSSNIRVVEEAPHEELPGHMDIAFWDFLGSCDVRHLNMLDESERETAARIEREENRGETVLSEVDGYLLQLRRQKRRVDITDEQRSSLDSRIALLEGKHAEASAWLVRRLALMRDENAVFEADIMDALQNHGEIEVLQTARWVARHAFDRVYRPTEGNFLMRGRHAPVHNPGAFQLLDEARRREELSEDERQNRIQQDRLRRLERWNARPVVKTRREQERLERDKVAALQRAWAKGLKESERQRNTPAVKPRPAEVTPEPKVSKQEKARIEQNRQRLRTAAQQKSAKRRADILQRDAEIADIIYQFPTVELLNRRLDQLPGADGESRRLVRLVREAIRQVSARDADPERHALDNQEQEVGT